MSQVRFLDQVSISSFSKDTTPATGNDTVIPRVVLPGTTFTVSANTNIEVSELIVAEGAVLTIEGGDLVIPGPNPVYSHGVFSVTSATMILGTVVTNGIFPVPERVQ